MKFYCCLKIFYVKNSAWWCRYRSFEPNELFMWDGLHIYIIGSINHKNEKQILKNFRVNKEKIFNIKFSFNIFNITIQICKGIYKDYCVFIIHKYVQ